MLPFLALGVLAQAPSDEAMHFYRSPLEIAKTLSSLGYPFKATGEDSVTGEISKGGARVWVGVARTAGDPAKGVPDTYRWMDLSIEFAAPKRIAANEATTWAQAHFPGASVSFAPHLGGTVTERMTISFAVTNSRKALRAALDDFFAAGKAFAKSHGTSFVAWAPKADDRFRFDDGITLDRADQISLERATASWGWRVPIVPTYVSQGWMFPIRVKDKSIWLRQATSGTGALLGIVEVVRYADEAAPSDYWQKAQAAGDLMPSAIYDDRGVHTVAAKAPIVLSKGVSLGELRRRIEAFAAEQP